MTGVRAQTGSITPFVVISVTALLITAGLVLDGGELLAAKRRATDVAAAAARVGAQAVDVDGVRRARVAVPDRRDAVVAARAHLRRAGVKGSVAVRDGAVHVKVRIPRSLQLLPLVGLDSVTVTGQGSARIVRGVTRGET